ncbi:hypothetical protein [Hymenobacter ruricola]|uniref:Uncharacterized protein n=1 Tax=Hymenobacter ruricola TaxID=2791023 RepID=A0ABS0HZ87_9BACT|nr:hypothetical protein [Hymenobacter ruricola]MBF9219662.1 hypothetical protein [Hymenobacter ruricola]
MSIAFNFRTLAVLLLAAPAARAQNLDAIPQLQDAFLSSQIANMSLGEVARANAGKSTARPAGTASLAYTSTPALRARTVQAYVDRLKPTNPTAAQAVVASLGPGKNDYGPVYLQMTKDSGLRENDAADNLASFLILGWMIVNNVQDGNAITVPMARGVRAQITPLLAANTKLRTAGAAGQVGEEMKLQFVLLQGGWQSALKENTLAAYRQGIAAMFKNKYGMDLSLFKLTDQGLVAKSGAAASGGAAGAAPTTKTAVATAPAAPSGTGAAAGAQWFFRSVGDAYGGITFEPVALLANGQYCDVGETPLETLNPAADKAKRPAAWGTWRKNGSAVVLTGSKGHTASYTLGSGSWFPAYAAGAVPLQRTYKNSRGGSMGGATSLVISKLNFLDDSHFSEGADGGVVTANAAGGSRRSASGTYRLQGHTLTLTYADGRTVRKSFAIGAAGTPAHADNSMIFIGGDAYIEDK